MLPQSILKILHQMEVREGGKERGRVGGEGRKEREREIEREGEGERGGN